jgi:phosphoserine phosphatase RsbU/P
MSSMSLKARFSLSIAVVYIVLGTITLGAIHFSTQKIISSLGTRFAIKQALLEKSKLMSQLQRDLSLSLKMASSPLLRQWLVKEDNLELKQQAMEELESYRQSFEGKSLFLAVADSGHYYFADGGETDYAVPRYTLNVENLNDAWFYRTMTTIESFELNIDYDNHLDVNKIWYNVVIRDRQGEKIGLGGSGVDITSFINQVVDIDELGIATILFSGGGTIEGHKDRNYVIHNSKVRGSEKKFTIFDLLDTKDDKDALKLSIDRLNTGQSEVENLSLSLQGKKYLAAIAYMSDIRWYNLVLIDAQQVIGSRSFLPILTISIVSLLIVVLIIIILLNRLVLTRLSVLAVSANRIAAGDFNISIAADSKDEIGALTSAFNDMSMMVKDHSENLEQKVVQRTEELNLANSRLADFNKQILDSIHYAQIIQTSILPSDEIIANHFDDFFALYLPRDIVGGDFYFCRVLDDGWLLAVIDCTGHGVPGAFMTMTANAVLSNIISSGEVNNPATIIENLNRQFHATLHRNSGNRFIDYGLDIGLCHFENLENKLIYSGARIDLHYVAGGEMQTICGQRKSIGYRRSDRHLRLENHVVEIIGDMRFYMTSDGVLDQAGGAKGWGFGRRKFGEMIKRAANLPATVQKEQIRQELAEYQGIYPQRDDITVIGFRLGNKK